MTRRIKVLVVSLAAIAAVVGGATAYADSATPTPNASPPTTQQPGSGGSSGGEHCPQHQSQDSATPQATS